MLLFTSATAFSLGPPLVASTRAAPPVCSLADAPARRMVHRPCSDLTSTRARHSPTHMRVQVVAGAVGAVLGSTVGPASAGYVTSLGIVTTPPAEAERDSELLQTAAVQGALKKVQGYRATASSLKQQFDSDTNLNLIPLIRKQFDFSNVRDDLNVVSAIFDEDTQLTIDRASRAILYDLTELETAARFKKKDDPTRTPKKVGAISKWFAKLDTDLEDFLAYFK